MTSGLETGDAARCLVTTAQLSDVPIRLPELFSALILVIGRRTYPH
jgi:hypothetical protein